jgi:hypothetical protein
MMLSMLAIGQIAWIAIMVAVLILTAVASYFLMRPKASNEGPDESAFGEFSYPSADEARLRPEVFGTVKIQPNLIWQGRVEDEPFYVKVSGGGGGKKDGGSEEVLAGYKVYLPMLYSVGGRTDSLREIHVQNARRWSGSLTTNGSSASVRVGQAAQANGSGGEDSTALYFNGTQTSGAHVAQAGGGEIPYLGTSLVFFESAFLGDNATSAPAVSFVVRRTTLGLGFGTADESIDGDANPALVAHYVLSKLAEVSTGEINQASFEAAAAALKTEGIGLAFSMERPRLISEWMTELNRYADAVVFRSASTGQWTYKLIRGDYDPGAISVITDEHTRGLVRTLRTWEDLPTAVAFEYMSRRTWKPVKRLIVNSAARNAVAYAKVESVDLTWLGNEDAAKRVMARMLRRLFYPLSVYKFELSRLDWPALNPGDPVRLTDSEMGINTIVRILAISGDGDRNQTITVEAVEDVYGLDNFEDPPLPASDFIGQDYTLTEPPAFVFVRDSIPEFALSTSVCALASPPATQFADRYQVLTGDDIRGQFQVVPTAVLDASGYPSTAGEVDRSVGFVVTGALEVAAHALTEGAWQRMGRVALIDSGGDNWELVAIRDLVDLGGGSFQASEIIRGLGGTPRLNHVAGARVWFLPRPGTARDGVVGVGGLNLATLSIALRCGNRYATGASSITSMAYGYRPETPYSPVHPKGEIVGPDVNLTWVARRRHRGACEWNIDNTAPFDDEPEGTFVITGTGGFGPVETDFPSLTIGGSPPVRTYTIICRLNGRDSGAAQITI